MSKKRIKVEGLAKLQVALERAAHKTYVAATQAVAQEAETIQADARRGAPVDTGKLRDGIRRKVSGTQGEVSTTARHAAFVEFGTSSAPAQPYMGPASERSRKRFPIRLGAILRTSLGGK